MGREWQIGDPVDGTTDGWMDAQNWGHRSDNEEDIFKEIETNSTNNKIKEYSKKAWKYYMNYNEEEALYYINQALDLNNKHANNWNIKAIILEGMKRYAESEECYNKSLELSPQNVVYDNKARMLYDWAVQSREESKKLPDGLNMLNKAYDICIRAIQALPHESQENIEKYLELRDSINYYINYEKEYQKNLEVVKKYDKHVLFTITGRDFYKNNINLTPGMVLKLVKEPDNEYDKDAIAVYVRDEKIGYVANNDYTKYTLTSSASQLHDKIPDTAQAEYLLYLDRYAEIQFSIGKIINGE